MEMLFPAQREMEAGEIYQDLVLPVGPEDRPYTVTNMVTTVDGKATLGGKAYPLGSKVDHLVMRRIRLAVDGVMNGAGTLREENVNPSVPAEYEETREARGLGRQPVAILTTATGDVPLDGTFFRSDRIRRIVVTTETAPESRIAAMAESSIVLRAGRDRVDLPLMMKMLREDWGIGRLLVEGGPTLNAGLLEEELVDELFWTVAPKILGGAAMRTMVEGRPLPLDLITRLELVSIHSHESELYLRYRVLR